MDRWWDGRGKEAHKRGWTDFTGRWTDGFRWWQKIRKGWTDERERWLRKGVRDGGVKYTNADKNEERKGGDKGAIADRWWRADEGK